MEPRQPYAPQIYFLHPLLIGPLSAWPAQFEHAAALGFDHVLIGSPFLPGQAGHLQVTADHERLHPIFESSLPARDALTTLAQVARQAGLAVLLDVVIDRIAAESTLYAHNPHWFQPFEPEDAKRDPRHTRREDHVAYANYGHDEATAQLSAWWANQLLALADAGIAGFRFDSPHRVPAQVWRQLGATVRAQSPHTRFLAATPGLARGELALLEGAGFDGVFSSVRWWDFRADWLVDEHAALVRAGSPIAFPEAPYGARLATDFTHASDTLTVERGYRRALWAAAALGTGWLVPMGFEYGVTEALSYTAGDAAQYQAACGAARLNLCAEIEHANALRREAPALNAAGELRALSPIASNVAVLLRGSRASLRDAGDAVLFMANASLDTPLYIEPARFFDGIPGNLTRLTPLTLPPPASADIDINANTNTNADPTPTPCAFEPFVLAPGGTRLYRAQPSAPIIARASHDKHAAAAIHDALQAPRIAIENVSPSVDHGRFAVKRVVGEQVEIRATILGDGHDKIAAAVIWRPADETAWHETPMAPAQPAGLDEWSARILLERPGRYEFTVMAWRDDFASLVDHMQKKRNANQAVDLEAEEAQQLFACVLAEAETAGTAGAFAPLLAQAPIAQIADIGSAAEARDNTKDAPEAALHAIRAEHEHAHRESHEHGAPRAVIAELNHLVAQFAHASAEGKVDLVLAPATAKIVAAAHHRPFLTHDAVLYRIDAERTAARFANWYELFPRSMSGDPHRHGTFDDVIAQLPRIRDMGFDVLYFPPIHPIGHVNRKGRNNTLEAQEDDVGSPYAIGSHEGGHTAIHSQLGTLDDFKRLLAAAHAHGLEIALDFAIQCAPDHPWLTDHPAWFAWRPDGTLRYAENPPKKYQDIVNPDFYTHDAQPALWFALRDIIAFWIDAGVHIFRVDNPHTKPLPFWEWLIDDIRARHPETIFLSEAFTPPRVMYRLAKLGFSQSYTYFTWRESKRDFIDYLTELTTTNVREFFRPNFFVNTPDINPRHLQSQGRAGFMIRAALASMLSGLWGVYCGFELGEAAALPNSEEYLDSEKYQLRAWDWNRPGNIVETITALNRIRRMNPALHTHLNVTFLPANHEHILFFEKATETRDNVILVAINLDAFHAHSADLELSSPTCERWNMHDWGALAVTDLMTGEHFEWYGRHQHVRLDPNTKPFAIWRITPAAGLPLRA
jgi:starch synthase (maltosyl-transferring)